MTSEVHNPLLESLTHREIDVLKMLADGASNQEIAANLYLEVSTVKWHNSQIYDKLGVKNRRQAVIRAQTLGIIQPNSNNLSQPLQHNLPADTHTFVGRVDDIQVLVQQLSDDKIRLVTILGAGGMGKTRLAIEVGRRLLAFFNDGVYFVPLAAVTSTEQIITTLAGIVSLKFQGDKPPKQQLLEHFHSQHILLIMDNFEHLVDSANLLSEILQSAPKTKVLATSREKLNLAGEYVHTLSGLAAPTKETTQAWDEFDAVKLFLESAPRTGVDLQDADMVTVARICRLVAGMPLAILLAAAWADTLSIAEILAEIKAGLSILEANLRDAPTRHHSIHAAFDVSWRRLSHHEQAVFMRLSVFQNGFTRLAAQKIGNATVRDLQRLVHTSFIQLLPSGRYAIHELMRQYGQEKLKASGELDVTCDKHAQYFAEFIRPLGETSWGMASREILAEVNAEFENIRAAWLSQVERKNIAELRRFLDGLWHFLDQTSRTQEGIDLFEPLLIIFQEHDADTNLFRGQILARFGWFYSDTGRHQKAIQLAKQALEIVQKFNAVDDILLLHHMLSLVFGFINEKEEARNYTKLGYELVQKTPHSKWTFPLRYDMSGVYYSLGQFEEAKRLAETLPEYKFQVSAMSSFLWHTGKYAAAEEVMLRGFKHYHYHRIDYLQCYSALIDWSTKLGNYKKAWGYVQRGLQYGDDSAYAWGTFYVLGVTMRLLIAEQQYHRATELLALILHHPANVESNRARASESKDILRANLPTDEFDAAWERGKQLDLGDVITEYMER